MMLGVDGQPLPPEIEMVGRQVLAARQTVLAALAQLDALAATWGVPVPPGMADGVVGQIRPAQTAAREEPTDPRLRRAAFQRPRLVETAPPVSAASIVDLLDRNVTACPSGAPTPNVPMTPLDVVPATGTGEGDGGRCDSSGFGPFGAPCA
jgi:hypothetical protein